MTRPLSFVFLSLIIVTFVFVPGCKKPDKVETTTFVSEPKSDISEVSNVMKRADKVPNFSWKDSSGTTIDFDSFRGKVTLINFWATWCGPCKKELPDLIEINREYAGRGVKIIGISADRGTNIAEEVSGFVHENGIPYLIVISNDELEEAFGNIRGLPTTFLVDEEGKIVQTFVGMRDKQFFEKALSDLLK